MGSGGGAPRGHLGAGGCRPVPETKSALRTCFPLLKGFPAGALNDHEEHSFPGGDATAEEPREPQKLGSAFILSSSSSMPDPETPGSRTQGSRMGAWLGLSPSPRAAPVCLAFTGSAGETGAPSGHEPASGGQLASFVQTDAGPCHSRAGGPALSVCRPRTRLPT